MFKGLSRAALFLLISLPNVAGAQSGYLIFPQFVAGPGLSSTVTLVNPDSSDTPAYVEIFNEDGTHAKDLPDGASFTVPSNGVRTLDITASENVKVGSVSVTFQLRSITSAPLFGSLLINIAGLGSSAVQQGGIGNTFVVPVQRTPQLRTGIAVANVCPYNATAKLTLRSNEGLPIGTYSITVPGNGHTSKFIDEMVPIPGTAPFAGLASIVAGPTTNLCVTTLSVAAYDLGSSLGQFIVLPVGKVN